MSDLVWLVVMAPIEGFLGGVLGFALMRVLQLRWERLDREARLRA